MNAHQELDMPSIVYLRWRRDLCDTLELHVTSSGKPYIPSAVVEERLRELDEEWKRRADKMAKALHECEYKARLQSQLNDGAGIMQDICIIVDEALSEYKKAIGE